MQVVEHTLYAVRCACCDKPVAVCAAPASEPQRVFCLTCARHMQEVWSRFAVQFPDLGSILREEHAANVKERATWEEWCEKLRQLPDYIGR